MGPLDASTFSCYRRQPYFATAEVFDLFLHWRAGASFLAVFLGPPLLRLPLDKSEGVKDEDLLCSTEHRVFRQRG